MVIDLHRFAVFISVGGAVGPITIIIITKLGPVTTCVKFHDFSFACLSNVF